MRRLLTCVLLATLAAPACVAPTEPDTARLAASAAGVEPPAADLQPACPSAEEDAAAATVSWTVRAPSGRLVATLSNGPAGLRWRADLDGALVASGGLGLHIRDVRVPGSDKDIWLGPASVCGTPETAATVEAFPVLGPHAGAALAVHELRLPCRERDITDWRLDLRVSDHGLAWRYVVTDGEPIAVLDEASAWTLAPGSVVWGAPRDPGDAYETFYRELPAEALAGERLAMPLLAHTPAGAWLAVTEADNLGWTGATLRAGARGCRALTTEYLETDCEPFSMHRPAHTPWRVTVVGDSLTAMVEQDLVLALNPPRDPHLPWDTFVRPGRSLYSWWILDNFQNTDASRHAACRYVKQAAALGLEYVTLDAGWWSLGDAFLDDFLIPYARSVDVGLVIWLDRDGTAADALRAHAARGFAGVKVDFFERGEWGRTNGESTHGNARVATLARDAAAEGLLVLLHGVAKPAGAERTWPNLLAWEAVRGVEYTLWIPSPTAAHQTHVPLIRGLAGPFDYTPLVLDPARLRGTTVANQLATVVALSSPMTQLAEDPARILASPAADLVGAVPSVWDRTVVVAPSWPGDLLVMARRAPRATADGEAPAAEREDTWWIAVLNGRDSARTITFDLTFLEHAGQATIVADPDPGLPEWDAAAGSVHRWERDVAPGDRLALYAAPGGGALIRVRPHPATDGGDAAAPSGDTGGADGGPPPDPCAPWLPRRDDEAAEESR